MLARSILTLFWACGKLPETVDEFFGTYGFLEPYRRRVETSFKNDGTQERVSCHPCLATRDAGNMRKTSWSQAERGSARTEQGFAGPDARLHKRLPVADVPMIGHATSGQPLLRGYHVGVTHTKGYAALMLSKSCDVACDIEHFSDRVERIKSKFLRKDEKADDLDSLLVHWCGKETVYKLFPEDNLQFSQMRVGPFSTMSDWACEVENMKRGEKVRVEL